MNDKDLNGVFEFMVNAYKGNWQFRFKDAPYMEEANSSGKKEPVLGHQWACVAFWYQLRRICPNLDETCDSLKVYEILLNHDLGETLRGDTPAHKVIEGTAEKNASKEEQDIEAIGKSLGKNSLKDMISYFEEFETEPGEMKILEAVVARYLDAIDGMFFAITFGNDLSESKEVLAKIVQKYFLRYSDKLTNLLKEKRENEAVEEVKVVTDYILERWKKSGVEVI